MSSEQREDRRDPTTDCCHHPGRRAVAVCRTHRIGYCAECFECRNLDKPCKYRLECVIYTMLSEE